MTPLAARTLSVLTPVFPSYQEARAAELAERRLAAVHAVGSAHLLRH